MLWREWNTCFAYFLNSLFCQMLWRRAADALSASVAALPGQRILISPIDGKWLVIHSGGLGVHLSMRWLGLQAHVYMHDRFSEFTCKLYNSGWYSCFPPSRSRVTTFPFARWPNPVRAFSTPSSLWHFAQMLRKWDERSIQPICPWPLLLSKFAARVPTIPTNGTFRIRYLSDSREAIIPFPVRKHSGSGWDSSNIAEDVKAVTDLLLGRYVTTNGCCGSPS